MAPLVCQTSVCGPALLWTLKLIHFYTNGRNGEREESREEGREKNREEDREKGGREISLIFNFVFPHSESLDEH